MMGEMARALPPGTTRVHPALRPLLRASGVPTPGPFEPSPFQLQALEALREADVLVEAPTGSGKTWIAEQAIREALGSGRRSWYTTPLKALSNQKHRRFCGLYGEQRVGLLTGERRVRPEAPVVVATTEVLRNALYDPQEAPDLVVLDEAHYLSDPERGTAWEEVILYAPPTTRLLLLSATLPNAAELADWMAEVRGRRPVVVTERVRPVPLEFLAADAEGRLVPLDRATAQGRRPRDWAADVMAALEEAGLLPAIFFFPARRLCDEAVQLLGRRAARGEGDRREAWRRWEQEFPHLRGHPFRAPLLRGGVAPHHAGHTTAWRLVVEDFLEKGLLRAVCATTTLAAGLDVPARTVVLTTLVRNSPEGMVYLSATEFHQMSGRAGRRGKDTVGFVVLPALDPDELAQAEALMGSSPEPIRSAFAPTYPLVLNLLRTRPMEAAVAELGRSLAAYQRRRQVENLRRRLESIPPDPLAERPCGDRLYTRVRYERMLDRPEVHAADLAAWPCRTCPVEGRCVESLDALRRLEQQRSRLRRELLQLEGELEDVFRARARVLQRLRYLDADYRPTPEGNWAARLRHPRCLVLAELVRRGLLPTDPQRLCGYAAALSTERAPRLGQEAGLAELARLVTALAEMEAQEGLPPEGLVEEFRQQWDRALRRMLPSSADRRAWAAQAWCAGADFSVLCRELDVAEGDLQRILLQAAEVCNQLAELPHAEVSRAAAEARDRLLRPPVL